ncbi:Plasmodium variant antigen protein Cir/Yir/Bir, putative, partial [Plasmodium chabaudi chabaudi]
MSKELCEKIKFADENIVFDSGSQKYTLKDNILEAYCSPSRNGEKGKCDTDKELLSSAYIALLDNFKSIDDENLDNDKLAQYAILWLNSKITQNTKIDDGADVIYETIIKNNSWFSEHHQYIDDKKDIMKFHYIYLNNLYNFLKGICETINKCSGSSNIDECIESAKKCAKLYRTSLITFPWAEVCNPYCRVLSNLKKDYDQFREANNNKDQLPELTPPSGRESCENYCEILTQKLNAEGSAIEGTEQVTTHKISLLGQSRTLTSINNGNKLPYIAIPFILIPIILGISYK